MNKISKCILAIFLVSGLIATSCLSPADAQSNAGSMTAEQKAAFQKVVRDYILENPEIISEAIERLKAKQRMAEAQADKETLVTNRAAIFEDADAPVGGNPKGDVTIVEFFVPDEGDFSNFRTIADETDFSQFEVSIRLDERQFV